MYDLHVTDKYSIQDLRAIAISNSLFPPTTLSDAVRRLGFVQADPIKSPATAQDLILRHRVNDYQVFDLHRDYAKMNLEEDYLYAYGFMPHEVYQLLHPRKSSGLSRLEKRVLGVVRSHGAMHPRDLEKHCGVERVINAWGGYSKATTRALEHLHHRGLLRVVGREKGIRIYDATQTRTTELSAVDRCRKLVLLIAKIFAPAPIRHLNALRFSKPETCKTRDTLQRLIAQGELETVEVDGIVYVLPTSLPVIEVPSPVVRFLAPFDPLVWDRARFELFWNWPYRFEAYTPVAKRIRGYYALPILWRDDIIGWANASVVDGKLTTDIGYVHKRPRDALFKEELDKELARLRRFLNLDGSA